MIRRLRPTALALLLAGLGLTTPAAAADLEALLRQWQVMPGRLEPAPAFTLETLEGKTVALAEHRGRAVLVYFWATW